MNEVSRVRLRSDSQKESDLKIDVAINQIEKKIENVSSDCGKEFSKVLPQILNPQECVTSAIMAFKLENAIKLIPSFEGDSTKLQHFIACCDSVNKVVTDKDIPNFIHLLQSKINDIAFEQTFKYNEYTTWDELKKDLINEFSELYSSEHLQLELINIYQKRDECVKDYARRIQEILSKLNEACIRAEGNDAAKVIKSINSKTALRAFQEGLHDNIKLIIKACRFENFKDAVTKACEEELAYKLHKQKTNFLTPSRQQVKCQLCFKMGHTASSCYLRNPREQHSNPSNFPTFPKSQGPQRFNSSNSIPFRNTNVSFKGLPGPSNLPNQTIKPIFICTYCKNPGHQINYCFKRRKANANKNYDITQDTQGNYQELNKNDTTCRVQDI